MRFLLCLCLAAGLSIHPASHAWIRKHARPLYWAAAALSVLVTVGTAFDLPGYLPVFIDRIVWSPLAKGSLATALFVPVMFAGALKNGTPVQKRLMSIRGELSIIASILTLGHNAAAGQEYFVRLFTTPQSLTHSELLASVTSLIMLVILLPLFITSFPAVRKKMKGKNWKKLQRLAYLFYGLTYLHVLFLFAPLVREGKYSLLFNLAVFSVVFLSYAALRIIKAQNGKKTAGILLSAAAAFCAALLCLPHNIPEPPAETESSGEESTEPVSSEENTVSEKEIISGSGQLYQNGTFSGKGKGYAGQVHVDVTIKNDRITNITVTKHKEDQPYWDKSLVTIDRILEEQQVKVDTVATATKSCKGIQRAVKDALKEAELK